MYQLHCYTMRGIKIMYSSRVVNQIIELWKIALTPIIEYRNWWINIKDFKFRFYSFSSKSGFQVGGHVKVPFSLLIIIENRN